MFSSVFSERQSEAFLADCKTVSAPKPDLYRATKAGMSPLSLYLGRFTRVAIPGSLVCRRRAALLNHQGDPNHHAAKERSISDVESRKNMLLVMQQNKVHNIAVYRSIIEIPQGSAHDQAIDEAHPALSQSEPR